MPETIEDGMTVIYTEKISPNIGSVIMARIVNVVPTQVQDDFKFNLIDIETGNYISKPSGERRAWMLNAVRKLKTFQLAVLTEQKLCSVCNENVVYESLLVCKDCIRAEKRNFFISKFKMDRQPFSLDDEQIDAIYPIDILLLQPEQAPAKLVFLPLSL